MIGFRTGPLKSSGGEDEDSDLNSVLAEVSEVEVGCAKDSLKGRTMESTDLNYGWLKAGR